MNGNIGLFEQGLRATAGIAAILNVVANPLAPAWLALIGAYFVLTSILTWDPVYAAARSVIGKRTDAADTFRGQLSNAR